MPIPALQENEMDEIFKAAWLLVAWLRWTSQVLVPPSIAVQSLPSGPAAVQLEAHSFWLKTAKPPDQRRWILRVRQSGIGDLINPRFVADRILVNNGIVERAGSCVHEAFLPAR
jgi:hypothetical protein